ncbi:MAG: DUF1622 domain-containing protein [Gordonia sp. (in: high G+C Gram-positive bacteria)]|uniref:DUF1622 domain-containing protein n=1 Tax=Gordonia sp. (in: high G+C Gram-positive bacteria) TaxID=84139 RepID=UPI0039E67202
MKLHDVFDSVADIFESVGVIAMSIGFIVSFLMAGKRFIDHAGGSFSLLRTSLGGSILLGLEIMVAADLIRTITSDPSLENVAVLGVIVILRTILSMSIQIEIDGTLPWKRALTESGGEVLAKNVRTEHARVTGARRAKATPPEIVEDNVKVVVDDHDAHVSASAEPAAASASSTVEPTAASVSTTVEPGRRRSAATTTPRVETTPAKKTTRKTPAKKTATKSAARKRATTKRATHTDSGEHGDRDA